MAIFNAGVAGLGGVIIEKLMKRNKEMSFWQQSSYLYTFGFLINIISVVIQNKKKTIEYLKFKNFNVYSYTLIFLYPYLGLITGGILKHLSSIIKTFATCSSLFLTSFISYYLFKFDLKYPFFNIFINYDLFNWMFNLQFIFSLFIVCISIYLYKASSEENFMEKIKSINMRFEYISVDRYGGDDNNKNPDEISV